MNVEEEIRLVFEAAPRDVERLKALIDSLVDSGKAGEAMHILDRLRGERRFGGCSRQFRDAVAGLVETTREALGRPGPEANPDRQVHDVKEASDRRLSADASFERPWHDTVPAAELLPDLDDAGGAPSPAAEARRWHELGDAELRQGRPHEAFKNYRKALALEPRNPFTLNRMGVVVSRRDWKEALQFFGAAHRLDPAKPQIADNFAIALLKNGRLDTAVKLVARRGSPLSYAAASAVMRCYAESPNPRKVPGIRNGIKWLTALLEVLGRSQDAREIQLSIFANYLHPLVPWREQALDRSADAQVQRWVRVSGVEGLKSLQQSGQGAILVVSHLAVERVATVLLSRMGFKLNTLEYENRLKIHGVARAESIKVWEIKESEGFMLRHVYLAKKALQRGEIFLLAGDGYHGGNEVPLPFLGRQRNFKGGFAELAIAAGVPAFPVFCTVDIEGRISLDILQPLAPREETNDRPAQVLGLVCRYAELLEDCWRRHPANVAWYHLPRYFALQRAAPSSA